MTYWYDDLSLTDISFRHSTTLDWKESDLLGIPERDREKWFIFFDRSQEQLIAHWLSSCLHRRWYLSRIMKTDKKDGIFNRYSQPSWQYPCKINFCADIKLGFVSPATGQRGHQHWILLDSLVLDSSCSTTRKLPTLVVLGNGMNPALHCSRNLPRCYLLPRSLYSLPEYLQLRFWS